MANVPRHVHAFTDIIGVNGGPGGSSSGVDVERAQRIAADEAEAAARAAADALLESRKVNRNGDDYVTGTLTVGSSKPLDQAGTGVRMVAAQADGTQQDIDEVTWDAANTRLIVLGKLAAGPSFTAARSEGRDWCLIGPESTMRCWRFTTNTSKNPAIELIWGTDEAPDGAANRYFDIYMTSEGTVHFRRRDGGNWPMMDIDYTTGLKVYQQAGTGQRMVSAQADGTQAAVASVVWTGSALVIGTDPGGSEILRIGGGLRLTSTITSTLATGTAPVSVTSTTACPNLNASLLLGSTWAAPAAIGSTTPAAGAFTSAVLGSDPGGSELLRVGGAARVLTTLVAGGEISGDELQVGDNSTYILKLTYGGGAMQAGTYSNRDLQLVTNSTVKAVLGTDGSIVLGTDPGGSDLLRVGGNVKCAALTASAATGAFQAGAQPVGGEDVSAWVSKTSSVAVARGFQSYLTHSGAGGSTAYDAVASTSATSGHNVCYQGVSLATGDATPSFLSFAYGSGDSASSETIANAYGYYWGGWTGAGTITNKWAFFNAATDKSYFGGDVYYNSKFAVGVSTSTALSWSLTINNPTTPLIAMQRADADFAYITNAATVLSGKPTTDLAIMHASTGAVWIGGNGVGMLKVDGTAVTVADASYVYLRGDASTDGSVRISSQSSGTAKLEARSGGTWSNISFT